MQPIKIGFWGSEGHQIHGQMDRYPQLQPVACGDMAPAAEQKLKDKYPDMVVCDNFDDLLNVDGLQMVSLCSKQRADQIEITIQALGRNIHVYAEKPCAIIESDLDRIIEAASKSQATFHEMAGTVYDQPYWAMKQLVAEGVIGDVVQVLAQKSYPMHERRPQCELIDGGLVEQNGVHAMRFVEHLTGLKATSTQAMQTPLGETRPGSDLQMAYHITGQLENGGLYAVIANYLNPTGFGTWGNEMVRVFGTKGMMESVDAGKRTRLVVGDQDRGEIDTSGPAPDWLSLVLDDVLGKNAMPIDLQTELQPTRTVIRARATVTQVVVPN